MTVEKSNVKKLDPAQRDKAVNQLKDNLELFELQAAIEQAKASIQKAQLEALLCTIKIHELKNPQKKDESDQN